MNDKLLLWKLIAVALALAAIVAFVVGAVAAIALGAWLLFNEPLRLGPSVTALLTLLLVALWPLRAAILVAERNAGVSINAQAAM
jgi:Mn2+/Fe2+ NRAMP family transporter